MTTKKFLAILFAVSAAIIYGEYVLALIYPGLIEHVLNITGHMVMYLCIIFTIMSIWLKTKSSLCLAIGSVVLLVEYGMSIFFNINLNQLGSMLWCDTALILIFVGLLSQIYKPVKNFISRLLVK
jgi:hypothetical protein